ncbi:MAG: bacteriohemerythrin [Anaeromyxobacteraceae bacterium]
MAIEWSARLAVGVELIDGQHRELFRRVNDLVAAMEAQRSEAEVRRILSFLGDYVLTHFEAEERLMRHHAYPEFPKHKAIHDVFVKDLVALKAQVDKDGANAALALKLNGTVCSWLLDHIGVTDRAFGAYLAKRAKGEARP